MAVDNTTLGAHIVHRAARAILDIAGDASHILGDIVAVDVFAGDVQFIPALTGFTVPFFVFAVAFIALAMLAWRIRLIIAIVFFITGAFIRRDAINARDGVRAVFALDTLRFVIAVFASVAASDAGFSVGIDCSVVVFDRRADIAVFARTIPFFILYSSF